MDKMLFKKQTRKRRISLRQGNTPSGVGGRREAELQHPAEEWTMRNFQVEGSWATLLGPLHPKDGMKAQKAPPGVMFKCSQVGREEAITLSTLHSCERGQSTQGLCCSFHWCVISSPDATYQDPCLSVPLDSMRPYSEGQLPSQHLRTPTRQEHLDGATPDPMSQDRD